MIKVFLVNFHPGTEIFLKLHIGLLANPIQRNIYQPTHIAHLTESPLTQSVVTLTNTADSEARGAVSSLLSSLGGALASRVAGARATVIGLTHLVLKFHYFEDAEH